MSKNSKHPVDASSLPYRPCVGQMVINPAGHVWIGCRADALEDAEGRGAWWQMPQCGIDDGEDPAAAAVRELYEETNIQSVTLIALTGWGTIEDREHSRTAGFNAHLVKPVNFGELLAILKGIGKQSFA